MRPLLLAVLALGGCAWTPVVHQYPSGLRVVRGDRTLLAQACGTEGSWDNGKPKNGEVPVGCYVPGDDTIYVRNTCEGAQSLLHEWAHREGVKDPASEGFNW